MLEQVVLWKLVVFSVQMDLLFFLEGAVEPRAWYLGLAEGFEKVKSPQSKASLPCVACFC